MFNLEADMQIAVTRALRDRSSLCGLSFLAQGRTPVQARTLNAVEALGDVIPSTLALALELKHTRCKRKTACPGGICRSRIKITKRELAQARALMRANGFEIPQAYTVDPRITTSNPSATTQTADPLSFKIPDDSAGYKPFDCFALSGVPAAFLAGYSCPHVGFRAYMIPIATFVKIIELGYKSLTPSELIFLGCSDATEWVDAKRQ